MSVNSVQEFEQRAREAEESPAPVLWKFAKAVVWFVYAIVTAVVIILLLAFVLRLVGASTDAAFTRWVYRSSESAMRPFRGIFPTKELGDASEFDASLLFGAVVYLCVALGVDGLHRAIDRRISGHAREVAQLRAQADEVRVLFESQQQQAMYAAQQQYTAQQFAAQQEMLRRQSGDNT